jgi:V8-like Glu-specific endopeptidase
MEENIKDEAKFSQNEIIDIRNISNVATGTVKIESNNDQGQTLGSGVFLKIERNNKPFNFLMTNHHIITKDMIEQGETITIFYDNEKSKLSLELNKKERIIQTYNDFQIDVTIVEIIPIDKIENKFFLNVDLDDYRSIKEKDIPIQVIQYPNGENLSYSNGKMNRFQSIDYMFYHDASTLEGSSGSPIVLKGKEKVIGIHKGAKKDKNNVIEKNVGIFIGIVIEAIKEYKKNGEGKEYYENGNLKYEGNFEEDEYEGDGTFYGQDGKIYIGEFKKGKKNGDFCIYNKEGGLIKECKYEDDNPIEENLSNDNTDTGDKREESEFQEKNEEDGKSDDDNSSDEDNKPKSNIIDIIGQIGEFFKPVGEKLGIKCTRATCKHEIKYHKQIGTGRWKCRKCPKDNNICVIDII